MDSDGSQDCARVWVMGWNYHNYKRYQEGNNFMIAGKRMIEEDDYGENMILLEVIHSVNGKLQ